LGGDKINLFATDSVFGELVFRKVLSNQTNEKQKCRKTQNKNAEK